jgi:hypothetical protein
VKDHEPLILSHRKIRNQKLNERRRLLSKTPIREIPTSQIVKSREDCESSISEDRWQQIQVPSFWHFGVRDIGSLVDERSGHSTTKVLKSRKDHSHPFVQTRGRDRGNRWHLGYRGFKLTEDLESQVVKSRNDEDRPSFGDAWHQSRISGNFPKKRFRQNRQFGLHVLEAQRDEESRVAKYRFAKS